MWFLWFLLFHFFYNKKKVCFSTFYNSLQNFMFILHPCSSVFYGFSVFFVGHVDLNNGCKLLLECLMMVKAWLVCRSWYHMNDNLWMRLRHSSSGWNIIKAAWWLMIIIVDIIQVIHSCCWWYFISTNTQIIEVLVQQVVCNVRTWTQHNMIVVYLIFIGWWRLLSSTTF